MKPGLFISAVCVASLLLFGCTDKKKMAELEATNRSLQAELQNVNMQLQASAADKAKIQELEQANQVLQAEIQKLHLQAMNPKAASSAPAQKTGATTKSKRTVKTTAQKTGVTAR